MTSHRPRAVAVAAACCAVLLVAGPVARARSGQTDPPSTEPAAPTEPTTTTTAPLLPLLTTTTQPADDATTTTTAPTAAPPTPPASPATGGDGGGAPDGLSPLGGGPGQVVPADAAAFISRLARSAPNDDRVLVAGEQALLAAGVDADAAARRAYGRFPVAGPAHWSDDWLDPRFTGTEFRYHLGVDVIAPYGTPLRSPDDGTIGIEQSDAGGLTVKVILPSGTFYELAHLSATAPGLQPGAPVRIGDLVGYVGTTGDATGPHLHLGYWVGGATAQSPKPLLDQWVADAAAALQPASEAAAPAARSLLGTAITRRLTEGDGGRGPDAGGTDLLLVSSGNPTGGALQVARATASQLAGQVDWRERAQQDGAAAQAWAAARARAWAYVGPLVPAALAAVLTR